MSFLLDKSIVRGVFEARVRTRARKTPVPGQVKAAVAYQLLREHGLRVCATPETARSASRRDARIAESIIAGMSILEQGRYLSRWARRLREPGFTREDGVVLAYGSFGLDVAHRVLGTAAVLTADNALVRNYWEQQPEIRRRFERMTEGLAHPYRDAGMPVVVSVDELMGWVYGAE